MPSTVSDNPVTGEVVMVCVTVDGCCGAKFAVTLLLEFTNTYPGDPPAMEPLNPVN